MRAAPLRRRERRWRKLVGRRKPGGGRGRGFWGEGERGAACDGPSGVSATMGWAKKAQAHFHVTRFGHATCSAQGSHRPPRREGEGVPRARRVAACDKATGSYASALLLPKRRRSPPRARLASPKKSSRESFPPPPLLHPTNPQPPRFVAEAAACGCSRVSSRSAGISRYFF